MNHKNSMFQFDQLNQTSMKNSKRQIVLSQITKSRMTTSDYKHKQNKDENRMKNNFKNDLNIIEQNQSNVSNENQPPLNIYRQDEEEEIIQSMNKKQKLLKKLQVLKNQAKSQENTNLNKSATKRNKLSKAKIQKIYAKIRTINCSDKKFSLSNQYKKFESINPKPSKPLMFNSQSTKKVRISQSRTQSINQFKSKKTQVKSSHTTVRKSINTAFNNFLEIVQPRKLEYDPDILMRSPNKSYLAKRKQKRIQAKIDDYGLAEYAKNADSQFYTADSRQIKDNSQKIPFRFQY